jgi:O-succinylbenzoic acid--CoA ligase
MADLSIRRAAGENPRLIALVSQERAYTFADGAELAARAITWLEKQGVAGEVDGRVALVATPSVGTWVLLLALVEMGVPVVLLHPRLTSVERSRLVSDSSPSLVVEDTVSAFRELQREVPAPERPRSGDDESCLAIIYTSGTTGVPKGAMLSRRAFVASARASAANLGWQEDDRWLLCMTLAHVGGLSIALRCLMARRTMVLASGDSRSGHFDPLAVGGDIEREQVTLVSLVPTMLQRLLQANADYRAPARLRAILLGGAPAARRLTDDAAARGLPVLATYGLTEACSQVTTQRYGTRPSREEGAGEPVAGTEVRIVDDRIEVRGASMMSGYLGSPGHTSPFGPGGWFSTGDLGRMDARGRLHVLGRRQDLIVTGGENVYPAEVEREIESIPGVRSACVFGEPDETWGEIVCVAIERDHVAAPTTSELATHLAAVLASHKRPRRVAFLAEFPLSPAGKVDRRGVRTLAQPHLVPLAPK